MHDLELNKILAACLVAGIIASASGFVAKKIIHPHQVKASGAEASGAAGGAPEAPQAPEPILDLIAKADANHGKDLAKACAACHNFDKGGPNGVGPNLWDVLTRGRAAKADYSYSDDMAKRKGEKWTYEDLNHFIWTPKSFVSGTKMTFPGYKKAQDRADVIAYLRTLTDSPPALPSAGEIAAEKKELGPKDAPAAAAGDKKAGKGAAATGDKAPADKSAPAPAKPKSPDDAKKEPPQKTEKSPPTQLDPASKLPQGTGTPKAGDDADKAADDKASSDDKSSDEVPTPPQD